MSILLKTFFALLVLAGMIACSPSDDSTLSTEFSTPQIIQKVDQNGTTATLSLNRTNLSTAETLELSLEVQAPENLPVELPKLAEKIAPFILKESYFDSPKTEMTQTLYRAEWTIYPGRPGGARIPSLSIRVGTNTLQTAPISLQIHSVLPEGTENAPLLGMAPLEKRLASQKARYAFLKILLLSASAGMLLIFLPWIFWKLRKRKPLKPHEKALIALEHLPEDPAPRLHALHHIFCDYIAARWSINLDGKTGNEQIRLLENEELEGEQEAALHFFRQIDPARFSHCIPNHLPQEAESTLRVFISKTFEPKEETS